jgi:hypothetical protein
MPYEVEVFGTLDDRGGFFGVEETAEHFKVRHLNS